MPADHFIVSWEIAPAVTVRPFSIMAKQSDAPLAAGRSAQPDDRQADLPEQIRADCRSPKTKKAREILTDLSGLPSQTGPTSSVIQRKPRLELPRSTADAKTKHLLRGTARVHLRE